MFSNFNSVSVNSKLLSMSVSVEDFSRDLLRRRLRSRNVLVQDEGAESREGVANRLLEVIQEAFKPVAVVDVKNDDKSVARVPTTTVVVAGDKEPVLNYSAWSRPPAPAKDLLPSHNQQGVRLKPVKPASTQTNTSGSTGKNKLVAVEKSSAISKKEANSKIEVTDENVANFWMQQRKKREALDQVKSYLDRKSSTTLNHDPLKDAVQIKVVNRFLDDHYDQRKVQSRRDPVDILNDRSSFSRKITRVPQNLKELNDFLEKEQEWFESAINKAFKKEEPTLNENTLPSWSDISTGHDRRARRKVAINSHRSEN